MAHDGDHGMSGKVRYESRGMASQPWYASTTRCPRRNTWRDKIYAFPVSCWHRCSALGRSLSLGLRGTRQHDRGFLQRFIPDQFCLWPTSSWDRLQDIRQVMGYKFRGVAPESSCRLLWATCPVARLHLGVSSTEVMAQLASHVPSLLLPAVSSPFS